MPTTSSLVAKLVIDYPQYTFSKDSVSHWSPDKATIYYDDTDTHVEWILLHELAHACLGHRSYVRDVALVRMEREAWQYANKTLAPHYTIQIDPDFIQDHLDTYRDWIHTKSTCPQCSLTGMETAKHRYQCLSCNHQWRTNTGTQSRVTRYNVQ